jgi:hypothetical protein
MASNTFSPNGLVWSRNLFGAAPTAQFTAATIKKGYGSNISIGDLVKTGTSGNQGYVILSAFSDTAGYGVFAGVQPYYDLTTQSTQHGLNGSYNSGANPSGDIPCWVITDPQAVFRCQAQGGPYTAAARGQNINWLTGTNGQPNNAGQSTLGLDYTTLATTSTLPFRVLGVVGVSGGPQDPANTNPLLEVTFNFGWLEMQQSTGI